MYQSIILKTEQLNLILKLPVTLAEFSQLSYLYVYYKLKQSLKKKKVTANKSTNETQWNH